METTIGPKNCQFDLAENVDKNVIHAVDFIIKHNVLLAEHTIKNEIRQLLSKYKYGNDIHEHEKQ